MVAAPLTSGPRGTPDMGSARRSGSDRRQLRSVEDDRTDAQGAASGDSQGRLGVHVRGGCVQSGADAESAVTNGSIRLSPGKGVPKSLNSEVGHTQILTNFEFRMLFGLPPPMDQEYISLRRPLHRVGG